MLNTSSQGDCPNISGKFLDEGEFGEYSYPEYKASLSHRLFGELNRLFGYLDMEDSDGIIIARPTHVLFSQNGNKEIKISVLKNDKEIYSILLDKTQNQFQCKKGYVKFSTSDFLHSGGVLLKTKLALYLVVSENYLTIKCQESSTGMMFFIPIVLRNTSWLRFKQIHK